MNLFEGPNNGLINVCTKILPIWLNNNLKQLCDCTDNDGDLEVISCIL